MSEQDVMWRIAVVALAWLAGAVFGANLMKILMEDKTDE